MPRPKKNIKKKTNRLKTKKTKAPIRKKIVSSLKSKKKVLSIPKGYNSITPYLIVSNAAKAIDFYKKAFDAKEKMRMLRPDGKIAHAELKIGDSKIMLADEWPQMNAKSPSAFDGSAVSIHLYVKRVDNVFAKALALGATLKRAVSDLFYGDRAGELEDPFGHKWFIATHIEDVSPAKIRKRAAEIYG